PLIDFRSQGAENFVALRAIRASSTHRNLDDELRRRCIHYGHVWSKPTLVRTVESLLHCIGNKSKLRLMAHEDQDQRVFESVMEVDQGAFTSLSRSTVLFAEELVPHHDEPQRLPLCLSFGLGLLQ